MSIDFSKIAELSTTRGKLAKLENSAGRIIWAADDTATVTITGEGDEHNCYVIIDGATYTSPATLQVKVGTAIVCYVSSRPCNVVIVVPALKLCLTEIGCPLLSTGRATSMLLQKGRAT